jgi:tetratricopeptide (TPR) repeat protein
MTKNRLRVRHQGESIELSWRRGNEDDRSAPAVKFEHPFNEKVLADLRWYLEDYLGFPYGLEPDKAKKIEQKFQEWGEHLYNLVFRSNEKARTFFQEATRAGLDQCELSISSDDSAILNLPWELLYSPDYGYLAPLLAGMYRSLSNQPVRAELGDMPEDRLNILLVIARPYGERDISLRTIARPMLEALAPIRQAVNLKVLRPPSFEQFERELNAHKGFYHIVHFDGHGGFDPNSQGLQHTFGEAGQGVLVFEKEDGSPKIVTATQLAQNLADCRVPIFVLNACQSGQAGQDPFSSVATRLVSLGAKGVVAMAYSVYAEAAKHFVGRLYEQLVLGDSLSSALGAGRREILNKRERPSPKGLLPLSDWMVPVLYQQETYKPFPKRVQANSFEDIMGEVKEPIPQPQISVDIPEAGTYGFIGRDYEILRLERAFRQNQVVLLKGMGGVGKTELVLGFAHWLRDTQGRTGGIFFTSFERGATLNNVVNQIGRAWMGDRFAQFPFDQQRAGVLQYLQTNPCLLIWDNFEPVAGFPQGNEPLLTQEEREELKHWLKEMRGGQSWVLITSRREEPWLDCGYRLENLSGLALADAEELAAKILQSVGVDRAALPKEYLELLKLLGSHPLSLRVVLPHLKTKNAVHIINDLHQGLDTFQVAEEEGRDKSLTVSLDYSFTKLSERARQQLLSLAFFCERVNAGLLYFFFKSPDDEFGQVYRAAFGENLQQADWLALLNEATEAGILENLDDNYYKIHPALPWYFRKRLSERHAETQVRNLEKTLLFFYAEFANHYRKQLVGNSELATYFLLTEEPNLLEYLRLAEHQQDWIEAQFILQALGEVYVRVGRKAEFQALCQRALTRIGIPSATAKAKGRNAFNFWRYLQNVNANEALKAADLEGARAVYQEILDEDELTALNDSSVNSYIAGSYHNLGRVAEEQRRYNEATNYYQKALKIFEDTQDFYTAAAVYNQLGSVAKGQRRYDDAMDYYQKALKIYEDVGDKYRTSYEYQGLGDVAREQGNLDTAAAYYQKAVDASIAGNDWRKASTNLSNRGRVLEAQDNSTEALGSYIQALAIDLENNEDWIPSDIQDLGRMLKQLGESQFKSIWKDVTNRECPGEIYAAVRATTEEKEE